jgi:hypothetical protein
MDVDDFGPILDVVQEGIAFIDRGYFYLHVMKK